jgi:branched-chain amino acid transport system substrate-binding protein
MLSSHAERITGKMTKVGVCCLLVALLVSSQAIVPVQGYGAEKESPKGPPIRFGVLVPLSGAQALLGIQIKRGAEIAAKELNQSGGIMGRPVELVIRDTKANPEIGVAAARELLSQGINLYFGIISSAVALAITPLMEKENGILITTAAHSDRLTHENFNTHYFRITDNPFMRSGGLARLMAEKYPNVTTWAGIIPDHEYGRTTWATFEAGLKKYYPEIAKKEVEIVSVQRTPYGATDYKNFITAALNSKAKGVYTSVYGADAVTLFRQAAPYGFFKKIDVLIDATNELAIPQAMGKITPPHWIGFHWYYGAYKDNPMAKKLYEDYDKEYKEYPWGFVAEAHSAMIAYKAAIEKAKSTDTKAVIKALEGLTFDSASGKRTIRAEDHQTIKDVNLVHVVPTEEAPGWKIDEIKVYTGDGLIEPPSPGKPSTY